MAHRNDQARQSAPTERRGPLFDQPERLSYEAAILRRNPRLASLLAVDPTEVAR